MLVAALNGVNLGSEGLFNVVTCPFDAETITSFKMNINNGLIHSLAISRGY